MEDMWQEIDKQMDKQDIATIDTEDYITPTGHRHAVERENNLLDIFQEEGIREITIEQKVQGGIDVEIQPESFPQEKRFGSNMCRG